MIEGYIAKCCNCYMISRNVIPPWNAITLCAIIGQLFIICWLNFI